MILQNSFLDLWPNRTLQYSMYLQVSLATVRTINEQQTRTPTMAVLWFLLHGWR